MSTIKANTLSQYPTLPEGTTGMVAVDLPSNTGKLIKVEDLARQINANQLNKPATEGTAGQILRTNGNGTTQWTDNPSSTDIGNAVNDWLDDNVPSGQTLVIDKTLSIENTAAESKAVGDELDDLKGAIGAAYKQTANLLDFGYIRNTWEQGGVGNTNLYQCRTKKIYVDAGETLYGVINKAKMQETSALSSFWMGMYLNAYDSNDSQIGSQVALSNTVGQVTGSYSIPNDCEYVIITLSTGTWGNNFTPDTLDNAVEAFAYLGYENVYFTDIQANYISYAGYDYELIKKISANVDAVNQNKILYDETITDVSASYVVWKNNIIPANSTDLYVTFKNATGIEAGVSEYGALYAEYTDGTSVSVSVKELNRPYKLNLNPNKTVSFISVALRRSAATLQSAVESTWDVLITTGNVIVVLQDKIQSMHKGLAGTIASNYATSLPEIDTYKKTFTVYPNTVIKDDRFANGYLTNLTTVSCDYSALITSAIVFCWKASDNSIKAFGYNETIDLSQYIPICMFRTSTKKAASVIPVIIDGKINGCVRSVEDNQNVKGIGHRGFTSVAPENTLISFYVAKEHGFNYVETDIRYTSDGVPVLLHDETINRTARNADGTSISSTINIADITYEQALTYDFGIWKGSAFVGHKIPTFEQLCIICHRLGLHPYFEIKSGNQTQTENLLKTAYRCGLKGKCTWESYSTDILGYVAGYDDTARIGLIADEYTSGLIDDATALKTGKNEVFLNISFLADVDSTATNAMADAEIPLETYTNSDSQMVANSYVTGIVTDLENPSVYLNRLWNSGMT